MKILAAIMDVVFVKFWRYKNRVWLESSETKKYLVYDPSKVTPCHYQKKEKRDG